MADVTDADRDKAYRALWPLTRYRWPRDDEMTDEQRAQHERVASALAEERETERSQWNLMVGRVLQLAQQWTNSGSPQRQLYGQQIHDALRGDR